MTAQIQELVDHYRLWNDSDEWYVEKATGIQVVNDLTDEWAHIWAGFRGIEDKPGAVWEEFLVDAGSWTWTTEVVSGYVKLMGDAGFAPAGKIAVHIEWTLEDADKLIEFKWRTDNSYKNFADVQQIIRNGQIDVNGAGAESYYKFYPIGADNIIGDLPDDARITILLMA